MAGSLAMWVRIGCACEAGLAAGALDYGSLRDVIMNYHIHELRGCDHCSSLIHFIYRRKCVHIP